ncbi:hypothetical protein THAOC_09885, partial [Thalassiosira oceanica]
MTSTSSNSHPDGAREETEGSCEHEAGEERVSSTSAELICLAQDDNGLNDTAEISAFLGQRERAKGEMTSVPQPPSSVPNISSAAVDVEGRASTSSASAGLCLADDGDGPINIAEISATLEQRDRDEKAEAKRDDRPPSNSSTSARLCISEDSEGPIDIAEISATLEQRDWAEKEEAQRINSQASYEGPAAIQGAAYGDGGASARSTSADLICQSQVDDGPMDTAEIAAFLGRQERANTANDRINRESTLVSQTGNPHDMARSDLSLMRGGRLAEFLDEDEENAN